MSRDLRALFVEDSEEDVILTVNELERGGFNVTSKRVETKESMIASLKEGTYDIIFSDHTMPRFSAPAALEILKQSGLDLPFVLLSGTLRVQMAVEIMRAGAQDYVDKGDLSRLVAIVEREIREVERRRTEQEALNMSQENFRILADTTTDWIYWLSPEMRLVYISPSVHQITGYRQEEFMGDPGLRERIIHPDDREWFRKHEKDSSSFPSMHLFSEVELRIIHKDGSVRWISHRCGPIVDQNKKLLGRHISNRDITRRKLIESELERKTEEAILSEQKAKTYFDFLAHDIANILSPMMIYADIIKLKPNDKSEVLKFTNKTLEQVKRAAALITNLRRLEVIDKLHPNEVDKVDLRTLFSAFEDNIRSTFPAKAIEISYDIPNIKSMVVRGGEWVENVFHCIYDNAVRYSVNSPVKLDIKASMQEEGGESFWRIEICDNGPGIAPNIKTHLTDTLTNSERTFKGVASSMPFCMSFIKVIGGKLSIEDRISGDSTKGTKVTIMLPRGE